MSSQRTEYSARDLAWPLFGISLCTILVTVAGSDAAIAAGIAWLWMAVPGYAFFRAASLRSPIHFVLASVVGIAASLSGVAIVGTIVGSFSIAVIALVPPGIALVAWFIPLWPDERAMRMVRSSPAAVVPAFIALALAVPPLITVGLSLGEASYYAQFFNADFFKHTAHVEGIVRGALPPQDSFAAGHRLSYYWLQYLLPAAAVLIQPLTITADRAVLAIGLVQTAVLGIALFAAAHRITGGGRRAGVAAAVVACTLALLSLSLDGLNQQLLPSAAPPLKRMMAFNQSPADITMLLGARSAIANVGFVRLNLYTPQHQLALILLATWVALVPRRGAEERSRMARMARLALIFPLPGISFMTGGVSAVIMAAGEWVLAGGRRARFAGPLMLAAGIGFCFLTGMLEPSAVKGDPFLRFMTGERPPLWERALWAPAQILTGFGLTAFLTLALWLRLRRFPIILGLTVFLPLSVILLVEGLPGSRIIMEAQYKTSYVLHLGLLLGTALWLRLRTWRGHPFVSSAAVILLVAGLISPLHDIIWFSTIGRAGTTAIPSSDMEALRWIRRSTPREWVFQQALEYPTILGGRDSWVPIFGGRAVRLAPRSSWATEPALERVSALLDARVPTREREALARELEVDALFVSRTLQPSGFDALTASLEAGGWIPLRRDENTGVWLRPDRREATDPDEG
ncbi:MAG: hypothetical protein ABR524_12460 [Thermoanaerobaculia bacterium]